MLMDSVAMAIETPKIAPKIQKRPAKTVVNAATGAKPAPGILIPAGIPAQMGIRVKGIAGTRVAQTYAAQT